MWTPRRIGLLFLGLAFCIGAFLGYSFFLGNYDGLPQLPADYLARPGSTPSAKLYPVPTTVERLRFVFGDNSPEGSADIQSYKNRLPIPGRDGVLACGSPTPNGTERVTVSPVSMALFGARNPRPKPGEVQEFTSFHADRAVITFDRPINKSEEMNTAKIVKLDLLSDPDDALGLEARRDHRRGRIWITNNRRSPDPANHLVVRTVGPLFVQLPDEATPQNPDAPHIWTASAVEVFDRQNLPYRMGARASLKPGRSAVDELTDDSPTPPVAAPTRPEDLRKQGVIAAILKGQTLPPPTVLAQGMTIYLAPTKKEPNAPPAPAGKTAAFSGVREMILGDGVQVSLWTDGGGGFPGTESKSNESKPIPMADPHPYAGAIFGALPETAILANRLERQSLLSITTPGTFRYNFEKKLATFDIAGQPPEGGQPNAVVATRLAASDLIDDLICQKLVFDLSDPDAKPKTGSTTPAPANDSPTGGELVIRELIATGALVYLSVQGESLEASGIELKHTRNIKAKSSTTVLKGTSAIPVNIKQNGNRLTAGDPVSAATVTIQTIEVPVSKTETRKSSTLGVAGPGRMELVERTPDAGERTSGIATWAKSLVHEKWSLDGREQDLLKFDENAAFVDPTTLFSLRSANIWLWLASKEPAKGTATKNPPAAIGSGSKPERLVATRDVQLDSNDLVIRKTNKLTVWFKDIAAPKPLPPQPAPVIVAVKPVEPVPMPMGPPAPKPIGPEPAKPAEAVAAKPPIPNPLQLQADTVESWVGRYSAPVVKPKPGEEGKLVYELQKAYCEENVFVHQDPDPNDPKKAANGLDIAGNKLFLENAGPAGNVLTVTGGKGPNGWASVAFEDATVLGPNVVIDQPNNTLSVDGRGRLRVLTSSDVAGNELGSPSELILDWIHSMKFEGAKSFAVFKGDVRVQQEAKADPPGKGPVRPAEAILPVAKREELPAPRGVGPVASNTTTTNLWCHQLDLTLDRPVYFNQLKKNDRNAAKPAPEGERPKIKNAVAQPDPLAKLPNEKTVVFKEISVDAAGELAKARWLKAHQIDFANRSKEQELFATGPGELRLLGPEDDDEKDKAPAKPGEKAKPIMKLTLVIFQNTMAAVDQGNGFFQEAQFDKGGVAMNAPTTDLMLVLEPHTLPPKSTYLQSEEQLIVSASKPKKDGPTEQRLTAKGNATFRDDTRTGLGETISYTGNRVTLKAGLGRMASLYTTKRSVTQQQTTKAKEFIYNMKTGLVEFTESSGGAILPGK